MRLAFLVNTDELLDLEKAFDFLAHPQTKFVKTGQGERSPLFNPRSQSNKREEAERGEKKKKKKNCHKIQFFEMTHGDFRKCLLSDQRRGPTFDLSPRFLRLQPPSPTSHLTPSTPRPFSPFPLWTTSGPIHHAIRTKARRETTRVKEQATLPPDLGKSMHNVISPRKARNPIF